MPTYHFRCRSCATETQVKLPFGSKELPLCTSCGKPMEKFIIPPTVHFKGSGFYKTDASKAPTPAPAKEPPAKKPEAPAPAPSATPPTP